MWHRQCHHGIPLNSAVFSGGMKEFNPSGCAVLVKCCSLLMPTFAPVEMRVTGAHTQDMQWRARFPSASSPLLSLPFLFVMPCGRKAKGNYPRGELSGVGD